MFLASQNNKHLYNEIYREENLTTRGVRIDRNVEDGKDTEVM